MLFLSLAIYGYSHRTDFFANSPCPSGELYVERVIGGWKQTPSTNPLGLCLNADDIKNDLVKDPTIKDTLISFFKYTIFNQQAQAAGNTYYVATNGNDGNPCTQSSPCKTINHGITKLSSGDTLIIRGGTYAEWICGSCGGGRIPSGSSWNNVTTLKGAPGETVILKPTSFDQVLAFDSESYISFENLILDGQNSNVIRAISTNPGSHHIRLKDSEVRFFPCSTFAVNGASNEFINLNIHDVATDWNPATGATGCGEPGNPPHVFYIYSGPDHLFANNLIDATNTGAGYCFHVYDAAYTPKVGLIFRSNTLRNCKGPAWGLFRTEQTLIENNVVYGGQSSGIWVANSKTTTIRHNTIYGQRMGIDHSNSGDTTLIQNNIIYGSKEKGIEISNGSNVTVSNNLSSNNTSGNFQDQTGTAVLSANLFGDSYDPRFVNPSAGDFHLQSGSPAIDAGLTLPDVPCDHDGNKRPAGSAYDIGAYEYGSSPGGGCGGSGGREGGITPSPTPPAPPAISLTATPSTLSVPGQSTSLLWTVSGATSCTASGGWSGQKNTQGGNERLTPSVSSTYTLTCTGAGGTNQQSVTVSVGGTTACTTYTSGSSIPQGFGVPWDVANPSSLLLKAECTPPTVVLKVGDGSQLTYIYHTAHIAPSSAPNWMEVPLFGTPLISNAWFPANAQGTAQIPDITQPTYYVAYTCHWTGSKWMCGCRDSACTQSYWQIQRIQR